MTFSPSARKCRSCNRQRLIRLDVLMCRECLGAPRRNYTTDESPDVLTGRWVPNGKGTMRYQEAS